MTRYRHALWAPSAKWPHGYQWGAPVTIFRERFPEKVKEFGAPLRVWESESGAIEENSAPGMSS